MLGNANLRSSALMVFRLAFQIISASRHVAWGASLSSTNREATVRLPPLGPLFFGDVCAFGGLDSHNVLGSKRRLADGERDFIFCRLRH